MWLIERGTTGTSGSRIPLPETLLAALVRWYTGTGTTGDEQAGIALVQQARIGAKWLACDCLGRAEPPPLLTPAYLSDAETYYLRRLTGRRRPEHVADCPFFRDQATTRMSEVRDRQLPGEPPSGYFEVIKPAPEKLAQRPDREAIDDRTRHAAFPRLALLLRRLLVAARLTCSTGSENTRHAVGRQLELLRSAAARIEVAPGVELGRVLWIHVAALHSRRLYAALRALEPIWPNGHATQGFLLVYADAFHGHVVHPANGAPFRVANRVQSPAIRGEPLSGPFLVLTVVGAYPEARGLAPLRAYAQPLLSGHSFLAVENDRERALLNALTDAQRRLTSRDWNAIVEKPVFDRLTPFGTARADAVIEASNRLTGETRDLAFLLNASPDDASAPALRALHDDLVCYASDMDGAALPASHQPAGMMFRSQSAEPDVRHAHLVAWRGCDAARLDSATQLPPPSATESWSVLACCARQPQTMYASRTAELRVQWTHCPAHTDAIVGIAP